MHPLQQPTFVTSLLGPLILVTAPTGLPLTRDECKDQLDLDLELDDDDLLVDRKINAAVRYVERSRGLQLMQATYDVEVRSWWYRPLRLPRRPLASVESVKYYAPDGTLTTLEASSYLVHTPTDRAGAIERAPDKCWPATQVRTYPIVIRFVAGYASRDLVPPTHKETIYTLVEFLYENRGAADVQLPTAVEHLLDIETAGGYA